MKKTGWLSPVCFLLSALFLLGAVGWSAYLWGYRQALIDAGTAAFSAPASVAVVDGLPLLLAAAVLFGAGWYLRRHAQK